MKLEDLKKQKNILILGFGKEGQDSYFALRKLFPQIKIAIADKKEFGEFEEKIRKVLKRDKNLVLHLGKDYLSQIKKYDFIIKSPGISLKEVKNFLKKKSKITSQTEIFFENCKGKIIGITGTKGKGTTSSLIYKILKEGGLKVKLVGNIGKPVLQLLLKSGNNTQIFVYELSSHQLQNLKKSPHIALFLNLYPAHLDYYKTFKNYQKAKENIAKWQKPQDFFLYNKDQKLLREMAKKVKSQKIPIGEKDIEKLAQFLPLGKIPLKGRFNLLNVLFAWKVGEIMGVKKEKIKKAVLSFKPLPHRLEFVGKYKGIEFYNDSLATVPEALERAIEAFEGKVKTLILGGEYVKGFKFEGPAEKILKSNIRSLIFLESGRKNSSKTETGRIIWEEIKKTSSKKRTKLPNHFFVSSMREAVKISYEQTKPGEICLLSPGAPSFNLFKNYKERGNLFKKYVRIFAQ